MEKQKSAQDGKTGDIGASIVIILKSYTEFLWREKDLEHVQIAECHFVKALTANMIGGNSWKIQISI